MDEKIQRQSDQTIDRQSVLDKLSPTRNRAEYLKAFEDHTDWKMFLWTYLPSFVIAYLLIGYSSGRWDVAVVAAMVVAVPGMALVGFITMPLASRTRWTRE